MSRKLVAKLMRQLGLCSKTRKTYALQLLPR
ncbi:MAG: hypothetical protein KIA55_08250 [Varibaculum cambriense]|nr:hypothetical protein [Varibaculum cambriense]